MKHLTDLGRIIFAIPFLIFGINHFFNWEMLALLYNTFIPIGVYTNIIVGLALIAVAISIIIKKFVRLSCLLLAGLLFIFILTIHIPQLFFNIAPENMDFKFVHILAMTNLLKDFALMGGAILIAGIYPKENNIV